MPTQRRFEGPTLQAVLAKVQKEAGANPQIISAQKIRTGGFLGFFQREKFEVIVEVQPATSAVSAPTPPAATSLLDLAEQTNQAETFGTVIAPSSPTATNAGQTLSFDSMSQNQATVPTAGDAAASLRDPEVRAALIATALEERRRAEQANPLLPATTDSVSAQQPSTTTESQPQSFAEVLSRLANQPTATNSDDQDGEKTEAVQDELENEADFSPEVAEEDLEVAEEDLVPTPQAQTSNEDNSDEFELDETVDELDGEEIDDEYEDDEYEDDDVDDEDELDVEDELDEYEDDEEDEDEESEEEVADELTDDAAATSPNTSSPNTSTDDKETLGDVFADDTPPSSWANSTVYNTSLVAQPRSNDPMAASLRTRITDAPLAKLGLPAPYVCELPKTEKAVELQRAISDALQRLPKSPDVQPSRGSVIAVIGNYDESLRVAHDLLLQWNRPREEVVVASQDWSREDAALIIRSVIDAENAKRSWSRRDRPTVVVIDTPLGSSGTSWAEHILTALEPIATYGVADATRKSEDISAWIKAVGGVDAIALNHIEQTVSPASVLATEVPVDRIDGRNATPELWAMLLTERLTKSVKA